MATPANFCIQTGPCAGSTPSCQGVNGWRCNYGPNVEVTANGAVAVAETRCDNIDNNCNGQTDESFPLKGQPCTVGNGICAGSSTYICSGGNSTACPATATAGNAVDEICNAIDDNCDGNTDERTPVAGSQCFNGGQHACLGWRDPMVQLAPSAVWIHQYEASRPDANSTSYGVLATRACSVPNRLPWESLNRAEAAAACAAVTNSAGQPMRLCTTTEWETACEGAAGVTTTPLWSYSSAPGTYVGGRCNDNDASTPAAPWATGSAANCRTPWGGNSIYDLSGNVSEWTSTSAVVNGITYYRVRGGNYQTFPQGTRCDFNFVLQKDSPAPAYQNFDLGFRCCSGAAP
jgi:hypothetical protein